MAYKISCRLVNQKIFYMMSLVGDELRLVKSIHIFLSESNAMILFANSEIRLDCAFIQGVLFAITVNLFKEDKLKV